MTALVNEADVVPVTALVFTLNEAVNLPHCLASLRDFGEVVVVDSFSTDQTETIAREAGAGFHQHAFTGFGDQRNWAMTMLDLQYDWLLILDADERVTPELAQELRRRLAGVSPETGAFQVRRRFYLWGRWLRFSSLYPTWVVRLVHRQKVRYENRGHSETQLVDGQIEDLAHDLIDENHKGMDDWFERQLRYATREAEFELTFERQPLRPGDLFSADPLTRRHTLKRLSWRVPARAIVYFIYAYFLRLGLLDGVAGFRFCLMKASYQHMIVVKKQELRQR